MRWQSLIVVALAGLVAAAPSGRPTSKPMSPATPAVAEAQSKAAAALAAASAAKAKAGAAFEASSSGKPLAAVVAAKQMALEQARATGTPQERLDASSAFVAAKKALGDARDKAVSAAPEVKAAESSLASATAAVAKAQADAEAERKAAEEKEKNDPIKVAVRKHQILKGMTEDQMKAAMEYRSDPRQAIWRAARDVTEEDGEQFSVWHIGYTSLYQRTFAEVRTVRVTCKDGVVTHVSQTRSESVGAQEPENP